MPATIPVRLGTAIVLIAGALTLVACDDPEGDVPGDSSPAASRTASATETSLPATTASPSPASTPMPSGWRAYEDSELRFPFPYPPGLTMTTEYFDVEGKDGGEVVQRRTISFISSEGVTAFGVGVEPDPNNLSLEEWARADGWPSEPERLTMGGEDALLFPVNEMGDRYPAVVAKHANKVYTIGGNVFGVPGAGYPPGISEADFNRILAEFKFAD